MPNSLVVVNTSPLLYLHQVGCLELLQNLYSEIFTWSFSKSEKTWLFVIGCSYYYNATATRNVVDR